MLNPFYKAIRNVAPQRAARWLVWLVYLVLLAFSISRHELWGDELHSWNIAKNSQSFAGLFSNIRYEGHPPLWYSLLFMLTRFSHDVVAMQMLHWCIAGATAYLLIFCSPFKAGYCALILAGYYFSFEYSVLCRNYALAVLLSFLLCLWFSSGGKRKSLYYVLLFLLSCTHLLGLIIALAFHFYLIATQAKGYKGALGHLTGLLLLLPALWYVLPPPDSGLNIAFWKKIWSSEQYLYALQVPLKSFFSFQGFDKLHFWNSYYMTDLLSGHQHIKIKTALLSFLVLIPCWIVLRKQPRVLMFFLFNLCCTMLLALVFPLLAARYVGFVYISFVMAAWLGGAQLAEAGRRLLFFLIILLQLPGAIVALRADWQRPFAHTNEIEKILAKVDEQRLATDYWTLNYLNAVLDRPIYCVGFNRPMGFLLWDSELAGLNGRPIYREGISAFMIEKRCTEVTLLSNHDPDQLWIKDSSLYRPYTVTLLEKRIDAIEKYSNLYLYVIRQK